jgi:hypothetical protein
MLRFYSGSTRSVNVSRGLAECLESAMGKEYPNSDLIVIHASVGHNFKELMKEARNLAPNATILAASCCGIVGREGVSESMKDIALMAIKGNDFAVSYSDGIYGYNSYEKCLLIAKELKAKNEEINMIYFLASGIDIANDSCIAAIEEVFGTGVTIFGATSSDNMKGVVNYQAINENVYEHSAFMLGFADSKLAIETQATHGFVTIGDPMKVTKADGYKILELDGKPAWSEFLNRLGLHKEATCGDSIPIGALAERIPDGVAETYDNNYILRVVTRHEGDAMLYATTIKEGTELWLTARDEAFIFDKLDKMTFDISERIKGKEIVAIFHADCLARGKFLFNRIIKEELVSRMQYPFYQHGECPPWLGMYGFGEYARLAGNNAYHNYTTALSVIYKK